MTPEEFEDESFHIVQGLNFYEHSKDVRMCEEKGCNEPSMKCEIDEDTHEYYCPEHAAENGYCCCCGIFIAGYRFSDMCEICEDETRDYD